jgi:hypothetical protein
MLRQVGVRRDAGLAATASRASSVRSKPMTPRDWQGLAGESWQASNNNLLIEFIQIVIDRSMRRCRYVVVFFKRQADRADQPDRFPIC